MSGTRQGKSTSDQTEGSIPEITFKKITDRYSYGYLGDFVLILDMKTGRINGSDLSKQKGKDMYDWTRLEGTKKLIEELSREKGLTKTELLMQVSGGLNCTIRGTYLHPCLITNLACWISPIFGAHICTWIEEWKTHPGNHLRYLNQISKIKPKSICHNEAEIRDRLATQLDGEVEVSCTCGFIDILTCDELIEVKRGCSWKSALGQLMAYRIDYPEHALRMHLFDCDCKTAKLARLVCDPLEIRVTREKS
jgi:hypothetical protein